MRSLKDVLQITKNVQMRAIAAKNKELVNMIVKSVIDVQVKVISNAAKVNLMKKTDLVRMKMIKNFISNHHCLSKKMMEGL